jgi:hypothetical protein
MSVETMEKKKRVVADDAPPPISEINPQVVLDNVFKQLGKPKDLCPISGNLTRAVPIKKRAFRVNIFRKPTDIFGAGDMSESFYVRVNDNGDIVSSDPAINKKY